MQTVIASALVPHLWSGKLIAAMLITFVVQGVTIGAYAARLAGVQTKRIATSISLFNLFVTTGRLANLFMLFFVGPLSDEAGNATVDVSAWHHVFELQLRSALRAQIDKGEHTELFQCSRRAGHIEAFIY